MLLNTRKRNHNLIYIDIRSPPGTWDMTCNMRDISFNMHNQELLIGLVLHGPSSVAQLQAIPLYGLIGWVTCSRAHKSSVRVKCRMLLGRSLLIVHRKQWHVILPIICFSIVRGQGRTIGDSLDLSKGGRGAGSFPNSGWQSSQKDLHIDGWSLLPLTGPLTIKMAARIHQWTREAV